MIIDINSLQKEFETKDISFVIGDNLEEHVLIIEKGKSEISKFTNFLYSDLKTFKIQNASFNTKKKTAYIIVKLLNFLFLELRIKDITEFKLDMLQKFLNLYGKGMIVNSPNKKNKETIDKINYVLKNFVYWLYTSKCKETRKKIFDMKYLQKDDFNISTKVVILGNKTGTFTKPYLENIVSYTVPKGKIIRKKVIEPTWYIVKNLLRLAEEHDPMITFAIALEAFCGFRTGEVVQMHKGRYHNFNGSFSGCWIDLLDDVILRTDNKITGHIKIKRVAQIHYGLVEVIKHYYLKHIEYLKYNNIYNHKYGAIFLNKNKAKNSGMAMLKRSYIERFSILVSKLYIETLKLVEAGNKNLVAELRLLETGKMVPHSLRYFYTQFLDEIERGNPFAIAYYRGDRALISQEDYKPNPTKEQIRKVEGIVIKNLGVRL